MTLDEWKALKAPRQKPKYNLRKAGEGEDPSQWKKMYALQKKKEGEEDDEDEEYVRFPDPINIFANVLEDFIVFLKYCDVSLYNTTTSDEKVIRLIL